MKSIGFFDSGVGGLSVLRQAIKEMPEENYIYYGDNANAPYGNKEPSVIHSLTMSAVEHLIKKEIKALVIACNTATSVAVEHIRGQLSIPVISMEPAIKPALENVDGKVLVMATPATLSQDRYLRLADHLGQQDRLINCPCDKLAGLIESHLRQDKTEIIKYLEALLEKHVGNVEGVVLGCTHYVFVKDLIKEIMGDVSIFDGNCGTVMHLKHVMLQNGTKNTVGTRGTVHLESSSTDPGTIEMFKWLLNYQKG